MLQRFLAVVLCAAGTVSAQGPVSVEISPNPILAGVTTPVTVTVTDATGNGFEHWGNCVARTIKVGSPNGPPAPIPIALCGGWTPVPANGSATKNFNFINILNPGLYYTNVVTRTTGGGAQTTTWAPFTIQNPNDANIAQATVLQVGMPWVVDLTAPTAPGTFYTAAVSFGTNTGFNLPSTGDFVSLDMDALFALSFPVALPGVFTNYLGVTDVSGLAAGITANVPNSPSLAYTPVSLQAGLVDLLTGSVTMTNVVGSYIRP